MLSVTADVIVGAGRDRRDEVYEKYQKHYDRAPDDRAMWRNELDVTVAHNINDGIVGSFLWRSGRGRGAAENPRVSPTYLYICEKKIGQWVLIVLREFARHAVDDRTVKSNHANDNFAKTLTAGCGTNTSSKKEYNNIKQQLKKTIVSRSITDDQTIRMWRRRNFERVRGALLLMMLQTTGAARCNNNDNNAT